MSRNCMYDTLDIVKNTFVVWKEWSIFFLWFHVHIGATNAVCVAENFGDASSVFFNI